MQDTPPCDAPLTLAHNNNNYFSGLALPMGASQTSDAGLQVTHHRTDASCSPWLTLAEYYQGCAMLLC